MRVLVDPVRRTRLDASGAVSDRPGGAGRFNGANSLHRRNVHCFLTLAFTPERERKLVIITSVMYVKRSSDASLLSMAHCQLALV